MKYKTEIIFTIEHQAKDKEQAFAQASYFYNRMKTVARDGFVVQKINGMSHTVINENEVTPQT